MFAFTLTPCTFLTKKQVSNTCEQRKQCLSFCLPTSIQNFADLAFTGKVSSASFIETLYQLIYKCQTTDC